MTLKDWKLTRLIQSDHLKCIHLSSLKGSILFAFKAIQFSTHYINRLFKKRQAGVIFFDVKFVESKIKNDSKNMLNTVMHTPRTLSKIQSTGKLLQCSIYQKRKGVCPMHRERRVQQLQGKMAGEKQENGPLSFTSDQFDPSYALKSQSSAVVQATANSKVFNNLSKYVEGTFHSASFRSLNWFPSVILEDCKKKWPNTKLQDRSSMRGIKNAAQISSGWYASTEYAINLLSRFCFIYYVM